MKKNQIESQIFLLMTYKIYHEYIQSITNDI